MKRYQIIILVILILAIASFFRLWQINSIPPGLYPDEAMNGNDAIQALETGEYKLFYPDNNGREGLFINLIALSFKALGVQIWSLRLVSALIGILTVLGLYLLTKELFRSSDIALLSAFFLATSFWHVNFSRIGFRGIMVPLLLVWSFYFLFKVINKEKNNLFSIFYLLISGLLFGLGFHTYIAFRVTPIILAVPIFLILLKFFKEYKKSGKLWTTYFKQNAWQYDIWIIAIIIAALPIALYFLQNPQDFIGRAGGVSIFSQENPLRAAILSTIKTLGMFNVAGDFNWRHNFSGSPQLLWPIGIFFLIGLFLSIKKIISFLKEKRRSFPTTHVLLLIWFGVMLLPAILTYEGLPHALRTIGAIPVCYIFAALGAFTIYRFLYKFVESKKLNKPLFFIACFLFLFACGYAQYDKYFVDWARQPDVEGAFAKNYVEIGKYLNDISLKVDRYVIVNQSGVLVNNIPMPAQTVMFIQNMESRIQNIEYLLPEEIDKIESNDNLVVIPLQYDREIFRRLKEKFPEGSVSFQEYFWLFAR